jgi:hypothetical protein
MIRDVPLYTSGGIDPFTNLPTSGKPATDYGNIVQLLNFHPRYARLAILITNLSGGSPMVQFTIGSPYGSNYYTLPTITCPQYVYIIGNENKTIITYLNTSWEVLQQVELPYNIFFNGVNIKWNITGSYYAMSVYIHFEFEDEEGGE